MALREWADQHRDDLVAETPNRSAVGDLLAVADRELRDAETVASADGQLGHAHNACLALSAAALAAAGYRVRRGTPAHHWRLVESLAYTLGLTAAEVKELQDYRRKRSRSVYERAGIVTRTEAQAALAAAGRLRARFPVWLAAEHPDLAG